MDAAASASVSLSRRSLLRGAAAIAATALLAACGTGRIHTTPAATRIGAFGTTIDTGNVAAVRAALATPPFVHKTAWAVLSAAGHEQQRDRGLLALPGGRLHGAAAQSGAGREVGLPLLRCNVRRESRDSAPGTDESAGDVCCAAARLDAGAHCRWQRDREYGGDRHAYGL